MGVTTRKKTGTKLAPAAPISKPAKGGESSRHSKGKKSAKASNASAKAGVGGSVGSTFPDSIEIFTDAGKHVKTGDLFELPGLVLFTYPRANTGGCTAQACSLRDSFPDLSAKGYNVVGLSYDSVKSQASWKAKHEFPYPLLCDTLDIGLIKTLGAHKAPKSVKRSVFIIRKDEGGKLNVVVSKIGVTPKDTVPVVMEYVNANPCAPEEKGEKKKEADKDKMEEEKKEKKDKKESEKGDGSEKKQAGKGGAKDE